MAKVSVPLIASMGCISCPMESGYDDTEGQWINCRAGYSGTMQVIGTKQYEEGGTTYDFTALEDCPFRDGKELVVKAHSKVTFTRRKK